MPRLGIACPDLASVPPGTGPVSNPTDQGVDLTPPGVAQGVPLAEAPGTERMNPQMEVLMKEVNELKQKVLGRTAPVEQTSPFAEEVMQDDMGGNYQPPRIADFDGTGGS